MGNKESSNEKEGEGRRQGCLHSPRSKKESKTRKKVLLRRREEMEKNKDAYKKLGSLLGPHLGTKK